MSLPGVDSGRRDVNVSVTARPLRAWRHRAAVAAVALGALSAWASSCVDGPSPSDLVPPARLSIAPSIAQAAAEALNISQIRVTVTPEGSEEVLSQQLFPVSPDAAVWALDVKVDVAELEGRKVVLTVELLSVGEGGVLRVEWSGRIGPLTVGGSQAHSVPIFPGPLDNLNVTGVTITPPSRTTLVETETAQLQATIQGGGSGARTVWTSLTPTVASVDPNGLVTTLLPGTARVVAEAGPRADTVELTVIAKLDRVEITPTSVEVGALGDTATFTATGRDPRGGAVTGLTFTWSVVNGGVATSLGDGRFRALTNGSTNVGVTATRPAPAPGAGAPAASEPAAAGASAPAAVNGPVSASAGLTVRQQVETLTVPATASVGVGGTTTVLATARDRRGNVATNATFQWTSDNPAVAAASGTAASTTITGVAVGTTVVRVTANPGNRTASVDVTVSETPVGGGDLIVLADVNYFDGANTAQHQNFIRNLVTNGDRDRVVLYFGHNSWLNGAGGVSYMQATHDYIVGLGYTVDVITSGSPGGLTMPDDASLFAFVMPQTGWVEADVDDMIAYMEAGGRILLIGENNNDLFDATNARVQEIINAVGSQAILVDGCLTGAAPAAVADPITLDVASLTMNCSSIFTDLGATDLSLFAQSGQTVVARIGVVGREPLSPTPTVAPEAGAAALPGSDPTRAPTPAGAGAH